MSKEKRHQKSIWACRYVKDVLTLMSTLGDSHAGEALRHMEEMDLELMATVMSNMLNNKEFKR